MPKLNAGELDMLYVEANNADQEIFSEMRSNILLISGDHYQRQGSRFWNRIRSNEDVTKSQKLRLTKNHIKKINTDITTIILSHAPAAMIMPNNEDEVQDQKTAELNNSVLSFMKKTLKLRSKTRDKAEDYTSFGEVCSKTFFDPDLGKVKGYEPLMDESGENVAVDEQGQPIPDKEKPVLTGSMVVERILPFNFFSRFACSIARL